MFTYCLNNPVCMVDSLGTEPTEAVDVDGDGEPDYYRYDYSYTYTVYLGHFDYSYEATISGSVYIFPETNKSFFENEDNIPKDFNRRTDLLVADVPGVKNITFYAYQAQYVMDSSRDEIVEILRQYDADFERGFNRSTESLLAEWNYHMLLGGNMGIPRSANVDFDRDAENEGLGFYVMKAIRGILGIP